jgi:hypothetical protein
VEYFGVLERFFGSLCSFHFGVTVEFPSRLELRGFPHVVAPVVSTLPLLLPLASYLLPPLPGIGTFFTDLGFTPTPFPANILPLFVLAWVVGGIVYATFLARRAPERYERLGQIVRGDREP